MKIPPLKYSRVLVVTDNRYLWRNFSKIVAAEKIGASFAFRFSALNRQFKTEFAARQDFQPVSIKQEWRRIVDEFDLVISLHCKQLFPPKLIRAVKCINIHPGLNPHNRGWFPQVFSIINKFPLGATIHEIDEKIDHGPIIAQEPVPLFQSDTSLTAYNRVVQAELRLIRNNLKAILNGDYCVRQPLDEGNLNLQEDFRKLCRLDLNERVTVGAFLDKLRALTHGDYKNAYFEDDQGRKIFVKIELQPDEKAQMAIK